MTMYHENFGYQFLHVLNLPMIQRCTELSMMFHHCGLRELEDIFPTLVESIFGVGSGGLGWGLRTITRENSPQCFDILQEFFSPMGPMMRLCYRLLNDSIEFEVSLDVLPRKVAEMLQSGNYSVFYADLVIVDPFRRQVTSMSLNAFDFYMLHFVVHATLPLHKHYAAAMQVHSELLKTVYFRLAAEYLCSFMPGSPDNVVRPTNISATAKTPQALPVQPIQPQRSPRYLKIPNTSLYSGQGQNSSTGSPSYNTESPRAHTWRTESVLYFFLDTWLRYDVDEARDLPSSEFIRVVRVLVKQTHTFSSSADMDHTAMSTLRMMGAPMMKAHIYPFLKSIISRWPLDSSMSVVLELWFSYIQPWRYTWEQNRSMCHINQEMSISNRFDSFIADNLIIYTQIFVQILPRLERLDFTSFRSAIMLYRLVKVFSQTSLPGRLYQAELAYPGHSYGFDTPQKRSTYIRPKTLSSTCEWETLFHDEVYTPLFGPTVRKEMEQFVKAVHISRMYVQQDENCLLEVLEENQGHLSSVWQFIAKIFDNNTQATSKLRDIGKIQGLLTVSIESLCMMFDIEKPNLSMEQAEVRDQSTSQVDFSQYNRSDYLDITKLSPTQMMANLSKMPACIDPALLPVHSYECAVLVRFLNQISSKINEMYADEIQMWWNRSDFYGKLARQILYPPMTAKWFAKPKGINTLCEEQLNARLCLRVLADYKVLALLGLSLIVGWVVCDAPIFGILTLLSIFVVYILILTLIS